MNPEKAENMEQITTSAVDPEDIDNVADYYKFEIDNDFSKVPEQSTFEKMAAFRQKQIQENKLQVIKATENGKTIGTSIVVLENGTMGKNIKDNEAWAAGTVIDKSKRGQGIGEKLSYEQDRIAREAGKESILTTISQDNFPSMRLRLKVGYELDGIDERSDETNYFYRKNLINNDKIEKDWTQEVESGKLKLLETDEKEVDDEILVDPNNKELIAELLLKGYRGINLLRPEDFTDKKTIDKNLLIFVNTADQKEKQLLAAQIKDQKFNQEKDKAYENDQTEILKIRDDLKNIK
jgi:L-amino acid N-acyltransferase YncA